MIGIVLDSTFVVTAFLFRLINLLVLGVILHVYALGKWLAIFSTLQTVWKYLLPVTVVVVIGSIMTPFPLWVLIILGFIPLQYVIPIIYVAFIVMMAK